MNKNHVVLLALSLAFGASYASATTLTWDLTSASSSVGNINTLTATAGGHTLKATGYCSNNDDGTGSLSRAHLHAYAGGVGISSGGDGTVCGGDSTGSPNHAIDNKDRDNLLLLEFDSPMKATAFQIGWRDIDADIQLWIGSASMGAGLSLTGKCVVGCGANSFSNLGFAATSVYEDVLANTSQAISATGYSRYLIVSGELGESNDYFKFRAVSAQLPSQVPLPPTVWLFGAGLVGLGWARRFSTSS